MSAPSPLSSSAKLRARSWLEEKPAATTAPSSARRLVIAAPMPRVPPVTSATRPERRPGRVAGAGLVSVTLMRILRPLSLVRALREPLGDLRPDLLARLRARHEADVAAGPVEVRHVLGGHEIQQRHGARPRSDVVRPGRDDEQVLVDPPQVDEPAAQPQRAAHEPVLLVHPRDPL